MTSSYYTNGAGSALNAPTKDSNYTPTVSRSIELLSCARTALKISKSEYQHHPNPPWFMSVEPSQLRLSVAHPNIDLFEDALSLLRHMRKDLQQLQNLVRRRGHTNDPTHEIGLKVQTMEADAKELASIVLSIQSQPTTSKQHKSHLQFVATWLQTAASQQTSQLKQVLKIRGDVLKDQAQRRKLLNPSKSGVSGGTTTSMSKTPTSSNAAFHSPLFTTTSGAPKSAPTPAIQRPASNTAPLYGASVNSSNGSGYYGASSSSGGYGGGGYGGGGYGGGYGSTGMRQRKASTQNTDNVANVQAQIQERIQSRESQARLESARHAERSLGDVVFLFNKMSSLIHSQGEVLENIEDDVEQARHHVVAGQEEIGKLYHLKKGNRALILKVFGIVIGLLIFIRISY